MSHSHEHPKQSEDEARKAKKTLEREVPNDANEKRGHETEQEPKPYLEGENVDNQKDPDSRQNPGLNTSGDKTPVRGTQISQEKQAHKRHIDRKDDKAGSKSDG
ncbi:hypothetical protein [Salinicola halophilus]|uniref:hypothetical protein n=1 Tax=Salinicola halophilus TaxID=184065 RepID=UPI000DA1FF4F|nr:hypothetical protein [Salinicola halophilus]